MKQGVYEFLRVGTELRKEESAGGSAKGFFAQDLLIVSERQKRSCNKAMGGHTA